MKKLVAIIVLICAAFAALTTLVASEGVGDEALYLPLVVKPFPTPTPDRPSPTPGTVILPTPTTSGTVTETPDPPISATETMTPTSTATETPEATSTATATGEATSTATALPSATATNTVQPTATATTEPTATNTVAPTATNTPNPTATNTAVPPETELVLFSWDGPVRKSDRGFPRQEPPKVNGDLTSPVNYAGGTIYVRFEIIDQPVPQNDMRLQFCMWQQAGSNKFGKETCVWTKNVPGTSGTVRCWSQDVDKLYVKGDFRWDRPRTRAAIPIKNGAGKPVSDYNGWNWNGENPNHWYPLDMKATVVIVAKGATFSGWDNYGGGC